MTQAEVARVAFFNYMYDDVDATTREFLSPNDGGANQLLEAMVPLAIIAFNERRSEFVPQLGQLQCNKNLSLNWCCSSGGNARVSFSQVLDLMQLEQFPHFIVGPSTSREAMTMAMATSSIPIVANWATSPRLSSKDLFPTFTRTIPSDFAAAALAARLALDLGFGQVGLLHESSDFGAGFKDALFTETAKLNISLKFSAYDSGNQASTSRAVRILKESQLNVIFVASFMDDLVELAASWETEAMHQGRLVVFLSLDSVESTLSRVTHPSPNDAVAKFLHGSLSFTYSVVPNPEWTEFKRQLFQGEFARYAADISEMFPPNGLGNDPEKTKCAHSNVQYPVMPQLLDGNTALLSNAQDIWAWTFDTVIAGGLALCELFPLEALPNTTSEADGQLFFETLLNLQFQGLSGDVSFDPDTGDRNPLTAAYVLLNYNRTAAFQVQVDQVGHWNTSSNQWDFSLNDMTFSTLDGTLPSETVLPFHEKNYLSFGLKLWGYIELGILNVLCAGSIAWIFLNRKQRVVINTQGQVVALMVFGCWIGSWTILALTADDNPEGLSDGNAACMAAPLLFSFGFQLALVAIIFKIYRIFTIFKAAQTLRMRRFPLSLVFIMIGSVMMVHLILLITWSQVAPLKFERIVTQTDVFGNPMVSFAQCTGSTETLVFAAIVFLLQGVGLIITGVASAYMRDLPAEFEESRYLNLAVVSMAQVFLIAVPSVIAVYTNPTGKFVICSTVVFVIPLVLLIFLLFPKMTPKCYGIKTNSNNVAANNSDSKKVTSSPAHSPVMSQHHSIRGNNNNSANQQGSVSVRVTENSVAE